MKKNTLTISVFAVCVLCISSINTLSAQAFRKGAFIINLSEGWTGGTYQTTSIGEGQKNIVIGHEDGNRDPIAIEYGISKHIGIGLSSGTDFYFIDPMKYYQFSANTNTVKATTTDFTLDGYYHFMTTAKTDFSVVASFGSSSVGMQGSYSDESYQYMSKGNIARLGVHARFYVGGHIGFLVMASIFSMTNSTNGVNGNSVGSGYTTTISGSAFEMGLCFRFKK
ncbi:MAG TPA: hypothetical protein VK806_11130 [Bacteroidia bacterium]|nr:hypothetical protein [Bacteroidia bacterium]